MSKNDVNICIKKHLRLIKENQDCGCHFFPTDHYVVINLRQDGKIIGTKETKGTSGQNPVWNAPFLFDLPSGDITQLPLVLEFIVMQVGNSALFCPLSK